MKPQAVTVLCCDVSLLVSGLTRFCIKFWRDQTHVLLCSTECPISPSASRCGQCSQLRLQLAQNRTNALFRLLNMVSDPDTRGAVCMQIRNKGFVCLEVYVAQTLLCSHCLCPHESHSILGAR